MKSETQSRWTRNEQRLSSQRPISDCSEKVRMDCGQKPDRSRQAEMHVRRGSRRSLNGLRSGCFSARRGGLVQEVTPEQTQFELHFIKRIPLCRLIGVSLQIATPLLLVQRDDTPRQIHAWSFWHRSSNTRKFTRCFDEFPALLLNFQLQLLEGSRLNFSLRIAFRMCKPLILLLPIYPIWLFHSGEHSQAVTI